MYLKKRNKVTGFDTRKEINGYCTQNCFQWGGGGRSWPLVVERQAGCAETGGAGARRVKSNSPTGKATQTEVSYCEVAWGSLLENCRHSSQLVITSSPCPGPSLWHTQTVVTREMRSTSTPHYNGSRSRNLATELVVHPRSKFHSVVNTKVLYKP